MQIKSPVPQAVWCQIHRAVSQSVEEGLARAEFFQVWHYFMGQPLAHSVGDQLYATLLQEPIPDIRSLQ